MRMDCHNRKRILSPGGNHHSLDIKCVGVNIVIILAIPSLPYPASDIQIHTPGAPADQSEREKIGLSV